LKSARTPSNPSPDYIRNDILNSTLRTREYVEKGENEGKTLLDAMRDGDTEGMQCFDGEIDKFIRNGLVDYESALGFATNPGNLRLQLVDFLEKAERPPVEKPTGRPTEIEP
jgi:twitching motility protein PilT